MRQPKPKAEHEPVMRLLNDNRERLPLFVVYDHPADFPEHFVARMWFTLPQEQALNVVLRCAELAPLQALMEAWGLVRLHRADCDDPMIVETWL